MRTILACLIIGVLLLPGVSGHSRSRQRDDDSFHKRIVKKLDLSEEQRLKIDGISEKDREKIRQLHEKERDLRKRMREAFEQDVAESELKKLHGDLKTVSNEMHDLRFNKILAIRKVLNPEQRKKFQDLKSKEPRRHKR